MSAVCFADRAGFRTTLPSRCGLSSVSDDCSSPLSSTYRHFANRREVPFSLEMSQFPAFLSKSRYGLFGDKLAS